jgi:uncharacterized protein YqeY
MIKDQIVEYRNQNPKSRTLLGTVIGELDRITKTPTNEQCVQVIKKMMEANNEINTLIAREENFILSMFLPSQLNEIEIKNILDSYCFSSIGECMKYFKDNYPGMYDGKLINKLFKNK